MIRAAETVLMVAIGVILYWVSVELGEGTILGGMLHLMSCVFVCHGIHESGRNDH